MKLTTNASQNLTEALKSIEEAANHLYQFHALGRGATIEEVEELEKKIDEIQYKHLLLCSKIVGEQRKKINQKVGIQK